MEELTHEQIAKNEKVIAEAQCRWELSETSEAPFYIMAVVVGIMSIILFVLAVVVYVTIRKRLNEQLKEAERNAHELMDAILVTLIPQGLLKEIAPDKNAEPEKEWKKKQ